MRRGGPNARKVVARPPNPGHPSRRRLPRQAFEVQRYRLKILCALRIVTVTGWGREADREKTRAASFDGHLVNPPGLAELQAVLAVRAAPQDVNI